MWSLWCILCGQWVRREYPQCPRGIGWSSHSHSRPTQHPPLRSHTSTGWHQASHSHRSLESAWYDSIWGPQDLPEAQLLRRHPFDPPCWIWAVVKWPHRWSPTHHLEKSLMTWKRRPSDQEIAWMTRETSTDATKTTKSMSDAEREEPQRRRRRT